MTEEMRVVSYIQSVQDVANQLTSIGESMAENDLVTHLLNSLPKSWDLLARNLVYITQSCHHSQISLE